MYGNTVAVAVGDIGDQLVEKVKKSAETLKVAPWTDNTADMGPVISKEHKQKILNYIDIGERGADLVSMEEILKSKVMKTVILLALLYLIMLITR